MLIAAWILAIGAGIFTLHLHGITPGRAQAAPENWTAAAPGAAAQVPEVLSRAFLDRRPLAMVFCHPFCPCTRDTLSLLVPAILDSQEGRNAQLLIVASGPAADPASVRKLLDASGIAEHLDVADVHLDPSGALARRFGAHTSGHAVVYAADGSLAFSGGFTAGRGVTLANPALSAALGSMRGEQATGIGIEPLPVFGCPLFEYLPEDGSGSDTADAACPLCVEG